jgi:hypothetical protein
LGKVADSGINPKPPMDVQAQYASAGHSMVRWSRIRRDVADKEIRIERYEVFRSEPVSSGLPPESATWSLDPIAVTDETFYEDSAVPVLAAGEVVYYRVRGGDDCGNNSDFSSPAKLDCAFSGAVEFMTPDDGDSVSGAVPVTVRVVDGSGDYSVAIRYIQSTGVVSRNFTPSTAGSSWTDNGWTVTTPGNYTITATVTNSASPSCSQSATVYVYATPASAPN